MLTFDPLVSVLCQLTINDQLLLFAYSEVGLVWTSRSKDQLNIDSSSS